jgi:3-hydroxyisobutyrate dehydrogenase-like beta-hydroxyacid dehydrogenase
MRDVAISLAAVGVHVIDSPVSGGRAGAEAGTLTMMAATPGTVLERQRDVLDAVGREIIHVGEEPGMGQTVKAALQALIGAIFAGTYESLVLAAKSGVSGTVFQRVVQSTGASCGIFDGSAKAIMERRFTGTGSQITTMYKDLGITMDAAKEHGVALFATSAAHELFKAGIAMFPEEDNQCVAKVLEQIAGTKVTE